MSKFNFERVKNNIEQMKRELPEILANDALRYFNDSFKKQGWEGQPWKIPQRKIAGTKAWKYPIKGAAARRTRATLVQSGDLRRTVATSLRVKTFNLIRFEVRLPYAERHNEGLSGMPKRKFMGDSKELRNLQRRKILAAIRQIWQA